MCKGAKAEELLLLALQGSEQLEPIRQWLKLLLQRSPKLSSMQAIAVDHGERAALFMQLHDPSANNGKVCRCCRVPAFVKRIKSSRWQAHNMRAAAQERWQPCQQGITGARPRSWRKLGAGRRLSRWRRKEAPWMIRCC